MIRRHRRESCLVVEISTPVASNVAMKIKMKWREWVGLTGNGQGSLGHGRSEGYLVCEFKYMFLDLLTASVQDDSEAPSRKLPSCGDIDTSGK